MVKFKSLLPLPPFFVLKSSVIHFCALHLVVGYKKKKLLMFIGFCNFNRY